ncbi:MAG: hypothetical protein M3478_03180, partial [Planctomycetota bacterium]|nr:hypothetical protein [Planctomycetota bacterium]
GGLVRAYANLGQLTQLQWSAAHQTFKARALLYAQRMTAAQPDAPGPLWHRAYGWTMAGAHAEAIKDLARAAELAKATKAELPSWVPLIDAACRYDTTHLLNASADADAPTAPLAAYLAFLTLENSPSVNVHRKFAEAAMQFNPSCLRPIDALVEVGGVSELHALTLSAPEIFKRSIFQDLPKMVGLPNEVKDALARAQQAASDPKSRADIAGALVAAGDPAHDAAEPSWAILGRTMQDTFFAQTHRRTHFMAFSWGLDQQEVWDFAQLAKALVGDHPYMPILEAYGSWSDWPKAVKLLGAVGLRDVNLGMLPLARLVGEAQETRIRGISPWQWMAANRDVTAVDLERLIRAYQGSDSHDSFRLELTRELHEVSPHSPIAIGALIEDDWEGSQPKLAQWERDYTNHPAISAALARQYAQQGKTDDAKRMWKSALAASPDWESYRALAGLYLREGDEAQWLATMETALAGEPHGLSDAVLRVDIARHFMGKGDYRRALPYATVAAETWAGWAMWCASHCYEGLEDWANAELWARRTAERYEDQRAEWYVFCRRTGKGDERAALRLARQYVKRVGEPGNADAARFCGMIHLLAREHRPAAKYFAAGFARFKDPDCGILAALAHDAAGDAAARDAAWDALLAMQKSVEKPEEWRRFFELVTLLKDHSTGAGLKDHAKVEAHLSGKPDAPAKAFYWAGRFFRTRGNDEAAKAFFARCATTSTEMNRTLASAELRDMGVEPRRLKAPTTNPVTQPK